MVSLEMTADTEKRLTSPNDDQSTFKWCVRVLLAGALFGIPAGGLSTMSPLVRLSLSSENYKQLAPRMMMDFFKVNFFFGAVSYALVDRWASNPLAKDGFAPYLGPLTAQIPALSCLVGSHMFYPGLWAFFNEPSLREKVRVGTRLTVKTLFAFAPFHLPAACGVGACVGLLMFPFKHAKRHGTASHEK